MPADRLKDQSPQFPNVAGEVVAPQREQSLLGHHRRLHPVLAREPPDAQALNAAPVGHQKVMSCS